MAGKLAEKIISGRLILCHAVEELSFVPPFLFFGCFTPLHPYLDTVSRIPFLTLYHPIIP